MPTLTRILSRLGLVIFIFLASYITIWVMHGDLLDPQGLLLIPNNDQAAVYVDRFIVGHGSVCLPSIPQGDHSVLFHAGPDQPDFEQSFTLEINDTNLISLKNAYQTDAMTVMNNSGAVYLHNCQTLTR